MRYGFKVVRDTKAERYTVFPIQELPNGAEGYRVKYSQVGTAEALCVFDTKAEAEMSYGMECEIARLALLPDAERRWILWNRMERLKEFRLNVTTISLLTGVNYETVWNITHRRGCPSVRQMGRIIAAADKLVKLFEALPALLPPVNLTGRPRPGHFVQPTIYQFKKRRDSKTH